MLRKMCLQLVLPHLCATNTVSHVERLRIGLKARLLKKLVNLEQVSKGTIKRASGMLVVVDLLFGVGRLQDT